MNCKQVVGMERFFFNIAALQSVLAKYIQTETLEFMILCTVKEVQEMLLQSILNHSLCCGLGKETLTQDLVGGM